MRTVIPFFVLAVLLNAFAGGLLYWSTAEADRLTIQRQEALAALVVSQLQANVALQQESVTVWDDAVNGVSARDLDWVDVNLGSWMNSYFGHDAAYIIGGDDSPIYASVGGTVASPQRLADIWEQAAPLAAGLRSRLRAGDETGVSDRVMTIGASDLVEINGRPAILSVKPIVSDSGDIEQVPGQEHLHLAMRYLDDSLVEELQHNYLLDGLRFDWSAETGPDEVSSPLRTAGRTVLGYFVWTPFRPGSIVYAHVWPVLISLFLAGMTALAGLILVLRRRSLALTRTQAEIQHLASHDVLTGLPNRRQFEHRMAQALETVSAGGSTLALLYLDLDRFKEVNDTLGHAAGDTLLREFSERLLACARPTDMVARLGGDEFVIVVEGLEDQQEIDQLCLRVVESARHPFELAGTQVFVGVSIGVALCPRDGVSANDLSRKADIALYAAKANGRSGYAIFKDDMEALIVERRALERDLRSALDQPGQFEVHYQPLFEAKGRTLVGVESLLRWNHPTRGRVGPDAFIPLAEESGLIEALGEFVLRQACSTAKEWPIRTLAVNVSAAELKSPAYAMRVANILMSTGFSPGRLELEVTETAMSDTDGHCQANIAALREMGVHFALDDFGTGFSSLGRLQQLDVDRIKIDRSFIHGFGTDNGDEAIVRAIIHLAKATGLKTTAEGVETEEQSRILGKIGCDELQGFLLGKPCEAAALEERFFGADRTPTSAKVGGMPT
ncbi:putative bifunctional diguanylate cyclase/phosphodiesterase [Neoaquamicrobium microcysteis]|uniref:putative bifunctional diguanylate cyclase/phosphodiesterase n=1 Tax=Neoaquamicrobium microcysteis TaxID=2682781 RepID=UPI002E266447